MQLINHIKLILLFSSMFYISCEKDTSTDNPEFKEFQVYEKTIKILVKDNVEYKFLVKEIRESRCPTDVNCIRAGEAIVIFDFEVGNKKYSDLQLCLGCEANMKIPQSTKGANLIDPLIITLNNVLPFPVSTDLKPTRYCVFTLE